MWNVEKVWPRVRFTSGQTVLLRPQEFDYENSQGQVLGSRLQVPLILAWALSIHKSQGQSLDRVKIDLARSFGSFFHASFPKIRTSFPHFF
ncbi:DNA repair and recombination protein pif1 [Puccinia sorghi]|uniref:DNA repair and recombination protein pif1 n=1 Tax=Puccinia sorghi TaxID=27349 RepID=A0A0L6UGA4_9BASI|nr:DNA repair and recombination protein pif1 [Puccinia sorghi]